MKRIIFLLSLIVMIHPTFASRADKKLKAKGQFEHPDIAENCQTSLECNKASRDFCESQKAVFLSCSEQYKGSWITTCICQ